MHPVQQADDAGGYRATLGSVDFDPIAPEKQVPSSFFISLMATARP